MDLGNKIKKIRIEKGLSQEELAIKINCAKNTISQYENNRREPDIETLKKISSALGIDVNYFFDTQSNEKESFVYNLLHQMYKQGLISDENNIDEDTKEMILQAVKMEIKRIKKEEKGI